jgi:hypothetical protein
VPQRFRETARQALDVGEHPVPALLLETLEGCRKEVLVIHHLTEGAMRRPKDLWAIMPDGIDPGQNPGQGYSG